MDNTEFIYCDKCGCPIDNQPDPKDPTYNFCPDCALKLFQKIFGSKESEQ